MTNVFESSGSSLDPSLAPIFVGSARLVTACFASLIYHKLEKKKLFLSCVGLNAVAVAAVGTFAMAKEMVMMI